MDGYGYAADGLDPEKVNHRPIRADHMKKFLKSIYRVIPFKKQILQLLKKIWSPPHRIYQHLSFKGVIKVEAAPGQTFRMHHYGFEIENEIFWKGLDNGWEKVSVGLWKQLCTEATVIFDIGANTGVYSLIAKTLNPEAKVFAFEPVDRVFEKLKRNADLNEYDIVCTEKAVSDFTGKAVIYDTYDAHVLSVTVNQNLQAPGTRVIEKEITAITLKDFIEEQGLTRIDLMKIDVETHEAEVLDGFGEYLARFRPSMLIEILSDEVGEKIRRYVEGLDYLYFNIDENKGIRQVDSIGQSDYYNYLICSKSTAQYLKLVQP